MTFQTLTNHHHFVTAVESLNSICNAEHCIVGFLALSTVHAMNTTFMVPLWKRGHHVVDTFTHSDFGHSIKMVDGEYTALYTKWRVMSGTDRVFM